MLDLSRSLLIRSLLKQPVERTPVWLMRQAGRYLPEYRQTRQKAGDFLTLCKTPELATEVTLQPLERFPLDAAIIFSDILTIPEAMGLGLSFQEGEGPVFAKPIVDNADIDNFPSNESTIEKLEYVFQVTNLIRREMPSSLPLIGFSGSPWTLACYMVEGRGSRDFKKIMQWVYLNPANLHLLLTKLADLVAIYLIEQIKNGANALMIFDTWGGILPTHEYQNFSLHYMQHIVRKIKEFNNEKPVILFTKGGGIWLDLIANTKCDAISLDWTCDLGYARSKVGKTTALQGNLNPQVLLTNKLVIRNEVKRVLDQFGCGSGLVFNLGHGITPDVPPENVAYLVEAVHELSPNYHGERYDQ